MCNKNIKVLVLQSDALERKTIKSWFGAFTDYQATYYTTAKSALHAVRTRQLVFHVLVLDVQSAPVEDLHQILEEARLRFSFVECILMTLPNDGQTTGSIGALDGLRCLEKPVQSEDLRAAIFTAAQSIRQREIHEQSDFLKDLVEVCGQLARADTLDQIIHLAGEFITSHFRVDSFFIGVADPQDEILHFHVAVEDGEEILIEPRSLDGPSQLWGLAGYVLKTGQRLEWSNFTQGFQTCQELAITPMQIGSLNQSCVYLPLPEDGGSLGVLSIQSKTPQAFSADLVTRMQSFASQLSVALRNWRVLDEETRRREEAEALNKAVLSLSTDLGSPDYLNNLLAALKDVVPYDYATVQLLDGDRFVILECAGFAQETGIRGISFSVQEHNPNREVYERKTPVVLRDAPAEYPQFSEPPHNLATIRSWLGVPILVNGELIGMFDLDKREVGFYRAQHARLAQRFAAYAALYIRNAGLLDENRQAIDYIHSIARASSWIKSLTRPQEILDSFAQSLREITGAWRVAVIQLGEGIKPLLMAQSGFEMTAEEAARVRPNGISWEVYRNQTPHFLTDIQSGTREVNEYMLIQGVRAAACLPFTAGGEKTGVVWIHFSEPQKFAGVEQALLRLFINQTAAALLRPRLLEVLTRAVDEDQSTLESIALAAQKMLRCDIVTLYSYDAETDEFDFPPAMVGVRDPEKVLWLGKVTENSLVHAVIERDAPLECPTTWDNPLLLKEYERSGKTQTFIQRESIESVYALPLKAGSQKVGVLFINYRYQHPITADERTTLKLFSNQAALAIRNIQYQQRSSRRGDRAGYKTKYLNEQLDSLESIYSTLPMNMDEVLRRIAEQAYRLTGASGRPAQFSQVSLIENRRLVFKTAFPLEANDWLRGVIEDIDLDGPAASLGFTGLAVKKKESQCIDDVTTRAGSLYKEYDRKTRSEVAVPILFNDDVIGVINVEHYQPCNFDQDDVALLEALARQAGFAIKNSQLLEYERQSRTYMNSLYEASQTIISSIDPARVLQTIVDSVQQVTGAWRAVALIIRETDPQPHVIAQIGFEDERDAQIPIRQNGVSWRVMRTQRPFFRSYISENDPDMHPHTVEQGTRAVACLPLKLEDQAKTILGVLWVHFREPHVFTEVETQALQLYATQSAIAYERAFRYEELARAKQMASASTATAFMARVNSVWAHNVEMNALTIRDRVEMLKVQVGKEKPDPAKVDRHIRYILKCVENILSKPINPPLTKEQGVESVLINDLVVERLHQLSSRESIHGIEIVTQLNLDDTLTVWASPEWLRRALDILVDNAVKSVSRKSPGQIVVITRQSGDWAEIMVQDNGPGIPQEAVEDLLTKSVNNQQAKTSIGIDFMLARTILETYGGQLRVDSSTPVCSMILSLPIEKRGHS